MKYVLYLLLIFFTIYTDCPLQLYLSYFGNTFIPVLTFFAFVYLGSHSELKVNDIFLKKYSKLLKYTVIVSLLALLVFWAMNWQMTWLGESLPVKMVKLILIFVSYWAYIKVLINLMQRLTMERIFRPFLYGLIVITLIALVEVAGGESLFNPLHFGENSVKDWDYTRVRLLCSEASHTAPIIEIFLCMSIYYAFYVRRTLFLKTVAVVCGLLLLFSSGSKTLMLAILIGLMYAFGISILREKRPRKRMIKIFTAVIVSILVVAFFVPIVMLKMQESVEESTTAVTRSYSVALGYAFGTISVIGTGFQTYLAYYPAVLKQYLPLIPFVFPNTDLSEIYELIESGSDANLSAKSFLSQTSMYWGIVGSIYFVKIYLRNYHSTFKRNTDGRIIFGTLMLLNLIQLLFTADMDYIVLAMISVFIILKRKNKQEELQKRLSTSSSIQPNK